MLKRIMEIDDRYVTAEVAARRLGVCLDTLYRYLALPRGDWKLVDGKWWINLESLLRRRAEDDKWREAHEATHVAVPAEPRVPVDTRPEPDWDAMPEWIGLRLAAEILGLTKHWVCQLAGKGIIPRKEQPGRMPTRMTHGRGARVACYRWLYLRDGVRRYWHRQERLARNRALRGERFRDWGPRDTEDIPPYWRDTVDTATAAEMLCVGRGRVAELCRTGKLPAYQKRPGHSSSPLRIPRVAVERLAMNTERSYWREIQAVQPEPPEPGEDRLSKPTQFRLDAERRDAAHRKRLEIGEFYDRASAEADRIREGEGEPEEGKSVQLGFGHTEWTPVDNDYVGFESWPLRREFGERELSHGQFYSTSQVARLLGVARKGVLRLRSRGRIQGYRLKKHANETGRGNWWWFYRKDEVEELVARRQAERRRRAKGRWREE